MTITVEFTKKCAGREEGTIETVYDETLAQDWINSGAAKEIKGDRVRKNEDRALASPQRK